MKTIFLLFFLFISNLSISQTKEDTTVMWFKYINKVDQTYLKTQFIRSQIYVNDFNIINNQIKLGNLKKSILTTYKKKSNFEISTGFDITFIHIFQTKSELIWNSEYVSFIENEINNNDFNKELLVFPLRMYHYWITYYQTEKSKKIEHSFAKKMSHQYDVLFYEAIKRWGLEELVLTKVDK